VEHLTRERIGPVRLDDLPRGKWRGLTDREIEELTGLAHTRTCKEMSSEEAP
jgi:16S rRNA U516 pseudouridylate synthase RsuA-like enzyme